MKRFFPALVLMAVLLAFSTYFLTSKAALEANFEKVENGMSQEEVRGLLGEPDSASGGSRVRTVFFYGGFRRLKWCTMEILFDEHGRVRGKFHDH